jgi:hypothetical protein
VLESLNPLLAGSPKDARISPKTKKCLTVILLGACMVALFNFHSQDAQ